MKYILYAFIIISILSCKKEKPCITVCNKMVQHDSIIDSTIMQLNNFIFDVTTADVYQYQSEDNKGNTLDCIKIIAHQNDTFIGVYHSTINNQFCVSLALSTDLIHWEFKKQLATKASQPTIYKTANNNFVVAWEQEPNNHLKVVWYNNFNDLLNNNFSKSKDIGHTLSSDAEGTPNIYYADENIVNLGFHYWCHGNVDRQASGSLYDFNNWQSNIESCIDNALLEYNLKGNIGDRDNFIYNNYSFLIIEGQGTKNNFGTWNCFFYNENIDKAIPIQFKTHHNSQNFANPTIYFTSINNRPIVLITVFIPTDNSGKQEDRELIYYKYL